MYGDEEQQIIAGGGQDLDSVAIAGSENRYRPLYESRMNPFTQVRFSIILLKNILLSTFLSSRCDVHNTCHTPALSLSYPVVICILF